MEVYGINRYFTVTELHVVGTPTDIEPRAAEVDALIAREFAAEKSSSTTPVVRGPIANGGRNNGLASLAGRLRRRGLEYDAIIAALLQHNASHCHPPLDAREVDTIARSISRYKPAEDTFALSENGDAEFFAATFGHHVRFDHRRGRFLVFVDHRWAPDADGGLLRLSAESIQLRHEFALSLQGADERKSRVKWAIQGESRRRLDSSSQHLGPLCCGRSCSITGITIEDSYSYTCACSMYPYRRCTARPQTRTHLPAAPDSPMAYDENLAQRIREAFQARQGFTERKMFGGLAFLFRGRMCCGIVGNDLMVRVAEDQFDAVLRERHGRPMDFTGRPLKGFVYVSPPGFRTKAALQAGLLRGERFVRLKSASSAKSRAGTRRNNISARSRSKAAD